LLYNTSETLPVAGEPSGEWRMFMSDDIHSESTIKKLSLLCIAVTVGFSLLAIAGWMTNFLIITRISNKYIPMAPSTAMSFILLSSALFFHARLPLSNFGKIISRINVFLSLLMNSIIAGNFFGLTGFDIENLFVPEPERFGEVLIGRMSPITASLFLLSGLALLLMLFASSKNRERVRNLSGELAVAVVLIGFIVLIGYLYGSPLLYGGKVIPVALTTGIAFVFFGLGIIFSQGSACWPTKLFIGSSVYSRMMRAFLPFVLVIIMLGHLLENIFLSRVTSHTLLSSLVAILSLIIASFLISKISRVIGREIDIAETRRREAEEVLIESEKKYRRLFQEFNTLLDAIPDTLVLQNPDLKIIWANRGAAEGLGIEVSDIEGKHCYELWHKRSIPCAKCPVLMSFQTGNIENLENVSPDGRKWDLRAFPVKDEKGKVVNILEIARDITEHRKLENQLRQAQKMEAIGNLTGGIAHDFNNILTAIIGYSEILASKTRGDEQLSNYVEQIFKSSKRAADLIQSLLAFSRKQLTDSRPLNINDSVKGMEKFLRRVIGEDIELNLTLADKNLIVMADSGQMEQVLMNLVTNARDAMPKGGVLTISTNIKELDEKFKKTYGYGNTGRYASISVTDTGVGMDRETIGKVFEPFFTTKEVGKGTGLGLSMAYGIIKKHNGYINCYSEPGKETRFSIYLPLTESKVEKTEAAEKTVSVFGKETVLVAEDDSGVRGFVKSILEEYGYKVIEAVDGNDAIKKFIENKDKIDFLVLDVVMPNKNGKEAYEEIRKIKSDIKALFTSGYTADIIYNKGFVEEGFNFISKPVLPTELLKKLREILDSGTV